MTIAIFLIHSSSSSQSFTCLTETATSCFTASKGTNMEGKRWDDWLLQWQTQVQTLRQWLLQWQTQVRAVRQLVVTMTNTSIDCETIGCYNDKHKYRPWDLSPLQIAILGTVLYSGSKDRSLRRFCNSIQFYVLFHHQIFQRNGNQQLNNNQLWPR